MRKVYYDRACTVEGEEKGSFPSLLIQLAFRGSPVK